MKGNCMWWAMPLTWTITLYPKFWEVSPFLPLVAMRILVGVSVDYLLERTLHPPNLCNSRKQNNANDWCSWKCSVTLWMQLLVTLWIFSSFACIPPAFFMFLQLFCSAASPLNHLCPLTKSPVSRWDKLFEFILDVCHYHSICGTLNTGLL